MQTPPIYLHFLDVYHYGRAVFGNRVSEETLVTEARRAFRLAVLHSDRIYLPASSYFEGPLAGIVLGDHSELAEMGVVYVAASQPSLEQHREEKVPQYPRGLPNAIPGAYTAAPHLEPPPYLQRGGSSRAAITRRWQGELEREGPQRLAHALGDLEAANRIERAWGQIPDLLGSRAFVTPHVAELLAERRAEVPEQALIEVIEPAYIDGYALALRAEIVTDLVYLASPFPLSGKPAFAFASTLAAFAELELLDLLDRANVHELIRFRDSPEWERIRSLLAGGASIGEELLGLANSAKSVAAGTHKVPAMGHLDVQVGIVTALSEEYAAMRRMLEGPVKTLKIAGDPNSYLLGSIPALRDGEEVGCHQVVLTQLRKAGNPSAASVVTNMFRSFPAVKLALMVGIACGIPRPSDPAKHVRLGDIVVSDRQGVLDFTAGAKIAGGVKLRYTLPPPSAKIIAAANALDADTLEGKRPWEALIEARGGNGDFARPDPATDVLLDSEGDPIEHPDDADRRDGVPSIFRGTIGSSNLLMRDSTLRDELAVEHGIYAIEMEGSGIADAAWGHDCSYGIIRGACDYGDDSKTDIWHNHAAIAAASYTRCLLERVPTEDLRKEISGGG
ncbi:MAG TPA: hypothetical protein VIS51_12135 [Solirubrobacterales bacterium]